MLASVGEADTIVRHPDLLEALVAGARDPVATQANLAELRALMTLRGFSDEHAVHPRRPAQPGRAHA